MAVRSLTQLPVSCLATLLESSCRISMTGYHTVRSLSVGHCLYGKKKFQDMGIDTDKYTMRAIPLPKSGGRNFTGRITVHGVGGGAKQRYRMIDFTRVGPAEGPPKEERVICVRYDPCRTARIAIVASGTQKRYILATENMKVGDIIKTSGELRDTPVKGQEGDAYPLGSLPIGSIVHNIELSPGQGATVARSAGTSAILLRQVGDRCVVKMPSKRELDVSSKCMATLGRVSNIHHNKKHIGSAGRARWMGIRPQSGLYQRKTGYHGRKIKPIKKTKVYSVAKKSTMEYYRCTV